ncbi:MAG: ABC transporter permease subunit [Propionibacteriaceae bacterium]|jgi:hypothetical protein|nr:ABC transporter permease subunit [Propionibacteriaceae bacterium]
MKTWSLTWSGLKTVAALELKQRVRSLRWVVALVVWFVVIGATTLLIVNAAGVVTPSPAVEMWCDDGVCHLPGGTNAVCRVGDGTVECDTKPTADDGKGGRTEATCSVQADGSARCQVALSDYSPPYDCVITPDGAGTCAYGRVDGWTPSQGPLAFSLIVLFVLGLGLLVAPSLTATSINGDRHAGTLATLQATRLSPAEIALGKLLAAWATMLAFLLAALPWLAAGVVVGGISVSQVLVCVAVLLLELAAICAIGLGCSALVNRTSGSSLITYASVVSLSFLTVIALGLLTPLVRTPTEMQVWKLPAAVEEQWYQDIEAWYALTEGKVGPDLPPQPLPPVSQCHWETRVSNENHLERIWWLLVPNPFAIVADAAPEPAVARSHPNLYSNYSGDLLFAIRQGIAAAAAGPILEFDQCPYQEIPGLAGSGTASPVQPRTDEPVLLLPWGLGVNLALGGVFFWIAVQRLKIPYGKLPKGTRVA